MKAHVTRLELKTLDDRLIPDSSYRISRFPIDRSKPVVPSSKPLHLCQTFASRTASARPMRRSKGTGASCQHYKRFMTVKTKRLECRRCQGVSCHCVLSGTAGFSSMMTQKIHRRSVLAQKCRDELSARERVVVKQVPRCATLELRHAARKWSDDMGD